MRAVLQGRAGVGTHQNSSPSRAPSRTVCTLSATKFHAIKIANDQLIHPRSRSLPNCQQYIPKPSARTFTNNKPPKGDGKASIPQRTIAYATATRNWWTTTANWNCTTPQPTTPNKSTSCKPISNGQPRYARNEPVRTAATTPCTWRVSAGPGVKNGGGQFD